MCETETPGGRETADIYTQICFQLYVGVRILRAFLESYRILCSNHKDIIEEFITRTEKALSENSAQKQVTKINKEIALKSRVNEFRKILDGKQVLKEFDRGAFESIIEKVIVGGYDEDGNKDPAMLTFIYKSGFENNVDGKNHKPPRRNAKGQGHNNKLSSLSKDKVKDLCSTHEDDTCGVCSRYSEEQ